MFLLIVLLFCFTVFAFLVTNKGVGKWFRTGDTKNTDWETILTGFRNTANWKKIRSCIMDAKVCQSLADDSKNKVAATFFQENLSPIQSGCCKPPTSCGFTYVSPIDWTATANATSDVDCITWSNNSTQLCYDCNSCKAGVLANLKHDWRKVAVVNIVMLIFLIIVYSVGCCAFRNNRSDNSYGKGYF